VTTVRGVGVVGNFAQSLSVIRRYTVE